MRRVLAFALTSLVVVAATGCGSDRPEATGIDLVTVTGAPDKKPKVDFEAPLTATKTQSKVVEAGSGPKITEGQEVVVDYVGINGRDKKEFDSSWQRGQTATFSLQKGALIDGFVTGLVGKSVGDRVLVTIPPEDGYGPDGQADAGIKGTDTLVFVVDVEDAYDPVATGEAVTPPAGLPTVEVDEKGAPTKITVPKTPAPKELVAQPLIRGAGEKVTADSTINFKYIAANWRTGKVFDSSWVQPSSLPLPLAQTNVKGLKEGLVGQTVGSRVLLVMPPDVGFGQDIENTDVKKTDTVVFVVDILHAS